jgi:hypothetical protein
MRGAHGTEQELAEAEALARPQGPLPLLNGYRKLSEEEQALANEVTRIGSYVEQLIEKLTSRPGFDQRAVAIGRTELQTGFMWLKRGITKPTTFS